MKCVRCKKNIAVVFVTKIEGEKQTNEGYCLSCAKELGVGPINSIIEQMGIDVNEIDEMSLALTEDPEAFEEELSGTLGFMRNFFGGSKDQSDESKTSSVRTKEPPAPKKKKLLDQYGSNLTIRAKAGELDRIIGRDMEIERVTQILNRRSKNNPVLLGSPGVGKTAIAEGLAVRIAEGNVPAKLLTKEIYLLDFTSIVAGTQFRGQFESRLKNIIDEAKTSKNVILVIDELHNIVGAGDAEGAMSAANILKPALSKGEIQVIGATTLDEYRKHIEKDSALERRFQPIIIEEPSVSQTIEIIKGIRDYYENYHGIKITDDVIRTATVLAERYITDRFLPDKAIDVIDEAGSRVNLNNKGLAELEKLRLELEEIQEEKDDAVSADSIEDYQKAADLKVAECQLLEKIEQLEKTGEDIYLTTDDVAQVIEIWTKIPVQRISEFESNKLMSLEDRLHRNLIGQNQAVTSVAQAIRVSRAGLSSKKRPVSFIFVGPTGVGKTELVKQLAKELFDSEEALIRLDMSEYMEKHAVSKLIGSPPGYVGYDDAGQLTEKVRRRPYSVILLDEIEKAHHDIFNILLQILDDGRVTDSRGKVVSFENTVIIMTSNAGSDNRTTTYGFNSKSTDKSEKALKELFRPEFLNRVDEIIHFYELSKDELLLIAGLMLNELKAGLSEKEITATFTKELCEYIVENGYDSKFGARPMRRLIKKQVELPIAEMIICDKILPGSNIDVTYEDGVQVKIS